MGKVKKLLFSVSLWLRPEKKICQLTEIVKSKSKMQYPTKRFEPWVLATLIEILLAFVIMYVKLYYKSN